MDEISPQNQAHPHEMGKPEASSGLSGGIRLSSEATKRPSKSAVLYVVEDGTGCWIWQRATNRFGYGRMWNGGRLVGAHRHFYEQANGPIPPDKCLDHLCRRPACVNPAHLEVVTHEINIQRGLSAKLTSAQVAEIRELSGTGESNTSIARRFAVNANQVWKIVSGRSWSSTFTPRPKKRRARPKRLKPHRYQAIAVAVDPYAPGGRLAWIASARRKGGAPC